MKTVVTARSASRLNITLFEGSSKDCLGYRPLNHWPMQGEAQGPSGSCDQET